MTIRLVSIHHRLSNMSGFRYSEALGLVDETRACGMELILFISEHANAAVRAALPMARPVLHCPVFRPDLSFDERTADFVAMLHQHVDPVVRKDDWVLITTGTQCEAGALAAWLGETSADRRPWAVIVFHNDRWNRGAPEERARHAAELRVAAAEIDRLDDDAKRRLIVGATTNELAEQLAELLGISVRGVPLTLPSFGSSSPSSKPTDAVPLVGLLGAARAEKGSHLIPDVIRATRRLKAIEFVVQLNNSVLPPETFAALSRIEGELGVEVVHGPLNQEAYRTLLARCDLVLLPYERTSYRQRSSGIFIEAAMAGRPVVVPSGTWMGNLVASGAAAGVVYEGDDPVEIAAAVLRAVDAGPDLAALARERAPEWERTMALRAFLGWLGIEIGRRAEALRRRPTLTGRIKALVLHIIRGLLSPRTAGHRTATDPAARR